MEQPTSLAILQIMIISINYYCTFSQVLVDEIGNFLGDREFDGVTPFEDITICGTNDTAFPFCLDPFQSPINIITDETLSGDLVDCNSQKLNVQFDQPLDFQYEVQKKSNTIQLAANMVTIFDNPVNPPSITNPVEKFCLEQIHFHWSIDSTVGGEHAIDGNLPPLEVHFVHYNCDRGSVSAVQAQYPNISTITAARTAGIDVYELGVLSVDFEITDETNPTITQILDAATIIQEQERLNCTNATTIPDCFDPMAPSDPNPPSIFKTMQNDIHIRTILTDEILHGGYFTYEGSLTTPPCTSDVRWFVFKKMNHISLAQFLRWRNLFIPCNGAILIAPNGRPLQNNTNPVYECDGENGRKDKGRKSGRVNGRKGRGYGKKGDRDEGSDRNKDGDNDSESGSETNDLEDLKLEELLRELIKSYKD